MASFHPHRQTVIITLVCALAVAGTATYAQWAKPADEIPQAVVHAPQNTLNDIPSSDSWKQQFFLLATTTLTKTKPAAKSTAADAEPLTLTDQIGRNFFANYLELKQGNLTTDDKAVQSAMSYTLDKTVGSAPQPTLYTAQQIHITTLEDAASLRTFGNSVGAIFNTFGPRADAAQIATKAFEQNDMTLLKNIDPIILAYQQTIKSLLQIPVPASLADQDLTLINGLSSMLYVSQGLRIADKDPMQSLVALGTYATAQSIFQSALQNMKSYFSSRNIFFSADEPGIMFLSISASLPQ